jgi:NAD-dependent deacetylase
MKILKNIVVLSGAGISAESGIQTFRDNNGLWENHAIEDVATYTGWQANPQLVLNFYNQRRKQLLECKPNNGHIALANLSSVVNVHIVTQNVDNLHEQAGSKNIIHLHGELLKVKSDASNTVEYYDWTNDLKIGDVDQQNRQLRPDIVWFGEQVPLIEKAALLVSKADILIVVGTSMQVYPAASLVYNAKPNVPLYIIDKKIPEVQWSGPLHLFEQSAGLGIPQAIHHLTNKYLEIEY